MFDDVAADIDEEFLFHMRQLLAQLALHAVILAVYLQAAAEIAELAQHFLPAQVALEKAESGLVVGHAVLRRDQRQRRLRAIEIGIVSGRLVQDQRHRCHRFGGRVGAQAQGLLRGDALRRVFAHHAIDFDPAAGNVFLGLAARAAELGGELFGKADRFGHGAAHGVGATIVSVRLPLPGFMLRRA